MEITNLTVWAIAAAMLAVGMVMVLFPNAVVTIENWLNRRWGDREIFSLRLGTQKEKVMEPRLNRSVLNQSIHWDGWLRTHPRITGAAICVIAVLLVGY